MAFERFPTFAGSGTYGTTILCATAHVKGAYVQIAASTGADCGYWTVMEFIQSPIVTLLADIALGAGGAEVVKVANALSQSGNDAGSTATTRIPVTCNLPSASRVAGRVQTNTGGSSGLLLAVLLNEAVALGGRATPVTYGANTATSGGSGVDPGGSAHTKGAYTQLTASTSAAADYLLLLLGLKTNTAPVFCQWVIDIATGAGGSETVIVPELLGQSGDLGSDTIFPTSIPVHASVAISTRVAVRSACTTTDATDRLFDAALIAGDWFTGLFL